MRGWFPVLQSLCPSCRGGKGARWRCQVSHHRGGSVRDDSTDTGRRGKVSCMAGGGAVRRWGGPRRALPLTLLTHRLGGEAHSMVWDPSGERLAVLMKGKSWEGLCSGHGHLPVDGGCPCPGCSSLPCPGILPPGCLTIAPVSPRKSTGPGW